MTLTSLRTAANNSSAAKLPLSNHDDLTLWQPPLDHQQHLAGALGNFL